MLLAALESHHFPESPAFLDMVSFCPLFLLMQQQETSENADLGSN